jgi:hypothetical protein
MEKNDVSFIRTRPLDIKDIKEVLRENSGKAIVLNSLPENTHWVLKITKEPILKHYDNDDDPEDEGKDVGYFDVEYKYNEDARIPLRLRVSANCYEKFMERNKGKEFVGKYALFSKKLWQNKNVQSIGVIYKEGYEPDKGFADPLDMLNQAENQTPTVAIPKTVSKDQLLDDIEEFIQGVKEQIEDWNSIKEKEGRPEQKKELSLNYVSLMWFIKRHKEEYDLIMSQLLGGKK